MDAKLISAGVDWLTLTTKDGPRQVEWREVFDTISKIEQANGWKETPAQQRGYHGKQIGHVFVGFFEGIGLARISSTWANEYGYWFSPDGVNCTRIDLQTTWEMSFPQPGMLRKWYEAARIAKPRNGRPGYYSLQENSEGGATLTANRRVSACMGRVYDKGREQNIAPAGEILRWEMECKEELANQAVQAFYASSNQEASTIQTLAEFFGRKSIPFPSRAGTSTIDLRAPKDLPDVEDTLRWLRGPVAKAVARSVGWVGMDRTLRAVLWETLENNSDCDGLLEQLVNLVDG